MAAPSNVVAFVRPGFRSHEEIVAQLEDRMAELEREAASPALMYPCKTCRYCDSFYDHKCAHPMVKGLGPEAKPNVDWQVQKDMWPSNNWPTVKLCGPEKALWEGKPKKLSFLAKFIRWLASPIPSRPDSLGE